VSDFTLIAAYAVFLLSYSVFALGKFPGMKIDRTGAAIIGAVLMVAVRAVRPAEALPFIDFGTIVLLFSMMLLVAYLHLAGFFDWVAERVVSKLDPPHLLPAIIFLSGLLSAFFVNDIVCLAMVPFTLSAARRMNLRPAPYLLAVATSSNIGSVATITGNPQNMLIGSSSGIRYQDFLVHLGPVALAGLFVDWLLIWLLATRGASASAQSRTCAATGRFATRPAEDELVPRHDHAGLLKPAIVAAVVLAGFLAGFSPPLVAALGAATMLITSTREPRLVYDDVDWGLLVFFVGLFLIVGGAENAGLMTRLLAWSHNWNLERPAVLTLATALLSNIVSNVPAVMLLKSLVPRFANPHTGWLLLAMASTLAGNLTITGSVANIIVVERARPEVEIGFLEYLRIGLPVTLVTLAIGWLWLVMIR
jgi:Na+/H+ antiporter NhaD/arsenite permease-like protein